jgi:hypothetical protein
MIIRGASEGQVQAGIAREVNGIGLLSIISTPRVLPKRQLLLEDFLAMSYTARVLFRATLMVGLTAGILVPNASAGSVSVNFGGAVTAELPNKTLPGHVLLKDTITNSSFAYNSADLSSSSPATGTYLFKGTAGDEVFNLNVNTPGFSPSVWNDGYNGAGSLFELQLSKLSSTTTLVLTIGTYGGSQGGKSGGSFQMTFKSTTYTAGLSLPTATTISSFLLTSANLTWDPGNDGWGGVANEFNGQSVPEPASLLLLGIPVTLAAVGFAVSRGRNRTRVC